MDSTTAKAARMAVEPLLPVTIARGAIRYAPGIKAGPWIFATGHKGVADFAGSERRQRMGRRARRHGKQKDRQGPHDQNGTAGVRRQTVTTTLPLDRPSST